MSAFAAMHIGATGADMAGRWMDALAHNVANVNTYTRVGDEPFRAKFLVVAEQGGRGDAAGRGVGLRDVVRAEGEAPVIHDPGHPLADGNGLVQAPMVDMAGQMSDLIVANRHYQASLRVVTSAHDAYQAALRIGRS